MREPPPQSPASSPSCLAGPASAGSRGGWEGRGLGLGCREGRGGEVAGLRLLPEGAGFLCVRGELGFDLQEEVSRFCLLVDKGGSRSLGGGSGNEPGGRWGRWLGGWRLMGRGGGNVLEPEWMRE